MFSWRIKSLTNQAGKQSKRLYTYMHRWIGDVAQVRVGAVRMSGANLDKEGMECSEEDQWSEITFLAVNKFEKWPWVTCSVVKMTLNTALHSCFERCLKKVICAHLCDCFLFWINECISEWIHSTLLVVLCFYRCLYNSACKLVWRLALKSNALYVPRGDCCAVSLLTDSSGNRTPLIPSDLCSVTRPPSLNSAEAGGLTVCDSPAHITPLSWGRQGVYQSRRAKAHREMKPSEQKSNRTVQMFLCVCVPAALCVQPQCPELRDRLSASVTILRVQFLSLTQTASVICHQFSINKACTHEKRNTHLADITSEQIHQVTFHSTGTHEAQANTNLNDLSLPAHRPGHLNLTGLSFYLSLLSPFLSFCLVQSVFSKWSTFLYMHSFSFTPPRPSSPSSWPPHPAAHTATCTAHWYFYISTTTYYDSQSTATRISVH